MFGNLVQIELIRLFKSRILKISLLVGLVIMVFWSVIIEFLISMNAMEFIKIDEAIHMGSFRLIMFIMAFSFVASLVTPLTVILTTCGYYTHRLAVNIEGAVRNRLKLCFAEITGIAIFVLAIYILSIPGVLICLPGLPAEDLHDFFSGDFSMIDILLIGVLGNCGSCVVAYLISKVFVKSFQSIAMSLLVGFLSLFMMTVGVGVVEMYRKSGGSFADAFDNLIMILFVVLPVVLLIIGTVTKFRKVDRI